MSERWGNQTEQLDKSLFLFKRTDAVRRLATAVVRWSLFKHVRLPNTPSQHSLPGVNCRASDFSIAFPSISGLGWLQINMFHKSAWIVVKVDGALMP